MNDAKPAQLMRDIVRDPSLLSEKRKELESLRLEHVADWAQNREFYRGNQWVFWNDTAGRIETLGVGETQKPRYKVRLTANVILPGVQQLVAQMTKTRPTIRATPDSGADRDVKAAEMAERLYEYLWDELGLTTKLMSALTHAQISQGYWLITWDSLAGREMPVTLDPVSGQPIWDDLLADGFRDDLRAVADEMGLPASDLLALYEQHIYVGDIRVQVLSGEQVWLDPSVQNFEDCAYVICKFPMTVDEVEARYGKKVTPNASTTESRPSLAYTGGVREERPRNVREVYHLYHRPTPAMPKGRYVCWIEDPNEILYQSDWEFPFTKLPLVKFPGIERPGDVYDEARVTHARPLQKELNLTVSGIAMHKNLTMKPQMLAPVGSLRQRLTDEPGAVIEYAPIQGAVPEWRNPPSLPGYVFEHLNSIQARIDRLFNSMPTERAQLPARTDSGQLVELVQEAVADQISPEIQRMERSLAMAGELMAAYAQEFYEEPRLLKIKGPGGSVQVKKFLNADLKGGFSFTAEAGSGLPRTRAGQVAQIREMLEMRLISPQEAVQYLPVAGLKGIQQRLQADEELAHRRVEKLLQGEPINVPAMQQAIMVLQTTGQNPMTGDFFSGPEEAMAFVEEAALSPLPHENLSVSLYVVGQHMKSVEFERYPPEVQDRFYQHYSLLQQATAGMGAATEPVKTTLSLKGTVGPTVAAEILQQSGIQGATPDTMREQPLETSVYDSVDKADADEAGNDPLSDEEKLLAIQQAAATHTLKMAKAQAEMDRADANSVEDDIDRGIRREREEELHQERLRQMRQPRPVKGNG
jgi:hypothetical protein